LKRSIFAPRRRTRILLTVGVLPAILTVVGASPAVASPPPGIITTIAGTGTAGYNGDNQPAVDAELYFPAGVAVDASGNVFIADTVNWRVREISASSGLISTVAGDGLPGYNGDGELATMAKLTHVNGIALDSTGDIFLSDGDNHRVRTVDAATGLITTVAGTGGYVYNGDDQPAVDATLGNPAGLAVDSAGDIFIADQAQQRVREVHASTGLITTVAGTGTGMYLGEGGYNGDNRLATTAQLDYPSGVAVDSAGDVFIAGSGDNRVREVHASTGLITTVAGTGTGGYNGDNQLATSAELWGPTGLALDNKGDLYISDEFNGLIREVNLSTGMITSVAGDIAEAGQGYAGYTGDNVPATTTFLSDASGVAVDGNGDVFIADSANNRIREIGGPDDDLALTDDPSDITTDATSPSGAVVTYPAPTVSDPDDTTVPTATCTPPSGTTFPIGTTAVTCTVSNPDDSNSPVTASFTVTVSGAADQLADLNQAVQGVGPGTSLRDKVNQAQTDLASGDGPDTCSTLTAFMNEVQAQSGAHVAPSTANQFVIDAQRIQTVLGC
jgi:hypothetical protein